MCILGSETVQLNLSHSWKQAMYSRAKSPRGACVTPALIP